MKYCTHCGNSLYDEAVICPKCGCAASGRMADTGNTKNNSISTLSMVGFILSFFMQLPALICSIIAYKNAVRDGNDQSKNFAKAGIIICSVIFGLYALLLIFYIILIFALVF